MNIFQRICNQVVSKNDWLEPWAGVVYDYHHYHTTAWECLCCIQVFTLSFFFFFCIFSFSDFLDKKL
jgi:hypothetical protein